MNDNPIVTRYCGDAQIKLKFLDWDGLKPRFKVRIKIPGGMKWEYDQLRGPVVEDQELTDDIYNRAAAGAIAWAARYNAENPEERPDWAPPAEFASELCQHLDIGSIAYNITMEPWGDTLFDGGW